MSLSETVVLCYKLLTKCSAICIAKNGLLSTENKPNQHTSTPVLVSWCEVFVLQTLCWNISTGLNSCSYKLGKKNFFKKPSSQTNWRLRLNRETTKFIFFSFYISARREWICPKLSNCSSDNKAFRYTAKSVCCQVAAWLMSTQASALYVTVGCSLWGQTG